MKNKDFLLFAGVVIGIIAIASVLSFATGKITGNVLVPIPGDSTPINCTNSDLGNSGNSLFTKGIVDYSYKNSSSDVVEKGYPYTDKCATYDASLYSSIQYHRNALREFYCTYDKKPAYVGRNCNKNFLTNSGLCFDGTCKSKSECKIQNIILNNVVGSNKEITLLSGETIFLTLSKIYLPTNQGYRNLEIRLTKEDSSYGSGSVGLNILKTDTGVVRSPIKLVSSSLDLQLVKQISSTSTIRVTNCPASA